MSIQADNLSLLLQTFGLSNDEAEVYLYLLKTGRSSALGLSKNLSIPRTRIYRILAKLTQKALIVEQVQGYGTKFAAESYENLNEVIWDKEAEFIV